MEHNVESISHMLTEFIHIVDSQSGTVVEVREMALDATENVKKTELELATTITRTESYQQSMVRGNIYIYICVSVRCVSYHLFLSVCTVGNINIGTLIIFIIIRLHHSIDCIILYYIVLYYIVLYYTVLYYIVLYCTAQ